MTHPRTIFSFKKKRYLATETTSSAKPQPVRGGTTSGQMCANKQYSSKDKHVVPLFKLLHTSNKLKLPEAKRLEEVGKTDDPNYLYHRVAGYLTKSCYIFKDVLQALINVDVLKLRPEQKKVTANMTSFQFTRDHSSVPDGVVPISKRKLKVINIDIHNKEEKSLVLVPTPSGKIM